MKSSVEPLDEIWNRAAEVSEDPFDAREALDGAAEHETGRGERRVERKSDQRHQPVVLHRFHSDGRGRMDVNDGAEIVRYFPNRHEARIAQRDTVDVAEDHRAAEAELATGAVELLRRCGGIAERKSGDADEAF